MSGIVVVVVTIISLFTHGVLSAGPSIIIESLCYYRVFSTACRVYSSCE